MELRKNNVKTIKFFLFLLILILLSGCKNNIKIISGKIKIGGEMINVEIANTQEKRILGLSNREKLCGHCGMLFLFKDKDAYTFWMKDMNFPLDIIWISDNKIVDIVKHTPIANKKGVFRYTPTKSADKVLEVNAGFADKYNIKTDEKIIFYPIGD